MKKTERIVELKNRKLIKMPSIADIEGAVVKGWCHKNTSCRVMDADLVNAITDEVFNLLDKADAELDLKKEET
ncbi:MAG: hypothetical protein MUC95_06545 [Spirochaetes bacterium]|nr:hypothetical protein [Spirochaetota bacterium]